MRTHLGELDHGGTWEDEERLIGHAVGSAWHRRTTGGAGWPGCGRWPTRGAQRLEAIVSRPPAPVRVLREPA